MNEPERLPDPRDPVSLWLSLILKEVKALREDLARTREAPAASQALTSQAAASREPRKPRTTK